MRKILLNNLNILVILLAVFIIPTSSFCEVESPSSPAGCYKYMFYHGWNLVSFPFLPEEPVISEVFEEVLTGGLIEEESDRIFGFDDISGEWISAWKDLDGEWHGELADTILSYESAYWIYINEANPDSQIVFVYGNANNEPVINRGVFEPGLHMVGSVWAGDLNLENSGLETAGFLPIEGLLPANPDGFHENSLELVLSFDNENGWYQVAWFDGGNWRGQFNAFEPAKGYYIWLQEQKNWYYYRRPDMLNTTFINSASPKITPVHNSIPLNQNYDKQIPPVPDLKNRQLIQNPRKSHANISRDRRSEK